MQYELDLVFTMPVLFKQVYSGKNFYKSERWLRLRYDAIAQSGGRCEACQQRARPLNPLHVDHIKPRSLYPWLAFDPANLQVLCAECNRGKGNVDETDWRNYDEAA